MAVDKKLYTEKFLIRTGQVRTFNMFFIYSIKIKGDLYNE